MADRTRFELSFNNTPRDRRVADWIDWQLDEGRNAGELIKNLLDELITNRSSITGRAIAYQGDMPVDPNSPADPVAQKLLAMQD